MKKIIKVFTLNLFIGSSLLMGALGQVKAEAVSAAHHPVKCFYEVYKVDTGKPFLSKGNFEVVSPEQPLEGYSVNESDLYLHEFDGNYLSLFFMQKNMTITLNGTTSMVAIDNSVKTPILSLFITSQSDQKIQYSFTCKR